MSQPQMSKADFKRCLALQGEGLAFSRFLGPTLALSSRAERSDTPLDPNCFSNNQTLDTTLLAIRLVDR